MGIKTNRSPILTGKDARNFEKQAKAAELAYEKRKKAGLIGKHVKEFYERYGEVMSKLSRE